MHKLSLNSSLGACIGIFFLILDSKTALTGARDGLQLIINTVIPSLFPFFFLSIWMTSTAQPGTSGILWPVGRLFQIPQGAEQLLIPAFLGGYPAGAQAVATAWEQGSITRETAVRLLGFCSNAGPSFLFGILASMFPDIRMPWILWGLHILGALLAARIIPPPHSQTIMPQKQASKTLPQILTASINVMANVCGWIILFRVVIAFLDRWFLWILPETGKVLLSGLLELTNGCCCLNRIADVRLRFVICSAMLSLGGLCVTMQTRSVTKSLDLRFYYIGKLIQTIFCISMSWAIVYRNWLPAVLPTAMLLYPVWKKQKSSSIPIPTGV